MALSALNAVLRMNPLGSCCKRLQVPAFSLSARARNCKRSWHPSIRLVTAVSMLLHCALSTHITATPCMAPLHIQQRQHLCRSFQVLCIHTLSRYVETCGLLCYLVEGDSSTASSEEAMLGTLSEGRRSLSANSLSSSMVKAYAPLFSLKCTLHAYTEHYDVGKGRGL